MEAKETNLPDEQKNDRVEAAKKRISEGKGTQDDFKLVADALKTQAKEAVDPRNLPAVGGWKAPEEGQSRPGYTIAELPNRFLENNGAPPATTAQVANAAAGGMIGGGLGNILPGTPAPTAKPAPKAFTFSGEIPAITTPASGTPNGETEEAPADPKMKQASEVVKAMKGMDELTIWDILEGGLKGALGNFDTTRKQKVADYKAAQKQMDEETSAEKKTAEERAFQREMLSEQLGQEKELAQLQIDAQTQAAVESRAAALEKAGYDRQTALMLANLQIQQKSPAVTPQQIGQYALTGGAR
jgi:hypothetical protein